MKLLLYKNKNGRKYVQLKDKKVFVPLHITNKYELIRWIIEHLTKKRKRRTRVKKVKPGTASSTETSDTKKLEERMRLEKYEQEQRNKPIPPRPPPPPPAPIQHAIAHQGPVADNNHNHNEPSSRIGNVKLPKGHAFNRRKLMEHDTKTVRELAQKLKINIKDATGGLLNKQQLISKIIQNGQVYGTNQSHQFVALAQSKLTQSDLERQTPGYSAKYVEPPVAAAAGIPATQTEQARKAQEESRKYHNKIEGKEEEVEPATKKTTPIPSKIPVPKRTIRFEDENGNVIEERHKFGDGIKPDHDGITDREIDSIMNKFPEYLGTISHNEMNQLNIKPKSRGGFIINTDPASKPGTHWQAVFFDARPQGSNEIDFYDSFGDPADKVIMKQVNELASKLNANTYLKFKENRIKQQSERSSNCGYFAMKFLIDRFNGKKFIDASGYSDVMHGEGDIEKFKSKFPPFAMLASFSHDQQGGAELGFGSFTPFINQHGDEVITEMIVTRFPISSGVNALIKMITLGQSETQSKKLGYDKLLHLAMNIKTNQGTTFSVEKTVSPHIGKWNDSNDSMRVNMQGKTITVKQLIENTIKSVGEERFKTYDAISQNCQVFLIDILQSNNLLTSQLHNFIFQDVSSVFRSTPWFQRIARTVTDIGAKINKTIYGEGHTKVQSILFDRKIWDQEKAIKWLDMHHFIHPKIEVTDNFLRFRQKVPRKDYKYNYKSIGNGVNLILV